MKINYTKATVTLVAATGQAIMAEFEDGERHWLPKRLLSSKSQDLLEEVIPDRHTFIEIEVQTFKLQELGVL